MPEGKKVDFLYTEADGVFVRDLKRKKHIEVSHAIMYEGWDKNGKRVSLRNPKVIMTTKVTDDFWNEVQALAVHEYSLENQIVMEALRIQLKNSGKHFHNLAFLFYIN